MSWYNIFSSCCVSNFTGFNFFPTMFTPMFHFHSAIFVQAPNTQRLNTSVDGRNPAPVEVGSLSHYSQGFYTSEVVGNGISEPSTVLVGYDFISQTRSQWVSPLKIGEFPFQKGEMFICLNQRNPFSGAKMNVRFREGKIFVAIGMVLL